MTFIPFQAQSLMKFSNFFLRVKVSLRRASATLTRRKKSLLLHLDWAFKEKKVSLCVTYVGELSVTYVSDCTKICKRSATPFYREEREESEDNAKIFYFVLIEDFYKYLP